MQAKRGSGKEWMREEKSMKEVWIVLSDCWCCCLPLWIGLYCFLLVNKSSNCKIAYVAKAYTRRSQKREVYSHDIHSRKSTCAANQLKRNEKESLCISEHRQLAYLWIINCLRLLFVQEICQVDWSWRNLIKSGISFDVSLWWWKANLTVKRNYLNSKFPLH